MLQGIDSHRARWVSKPGLKRPANEKPYIFVPSDFRAEHAEVPDIAKKPLSETAFFVE